jgi:F-type H+-transporting ATPase subunit delta
MRTNKQARREAKELFRVCLVNGLLDEGRVRQALQRVAQAKPRGYMALLAHFQRLVKLDLERRTARVETAVPLPAPAQAAVAASLTQRYGPGLRLGFAHRPELVGGMRVRVGSDVYDGTIHARLAALEESL